MSAHRRHRGFTLIEVMVAVAIMTVGTVGLLSMHQAALLANRAGRQMAQGTNITRTWIQRIKRDAFAWNEKGDPDEDSNMVSQLLNTEYLKLLGNEPDSTGWFKPVPTDTAQWDPGPEHSWGFDWIANDTRTAADIRFCTHARLNWVRWGSSVRVDVRTFWIREGVRASVIATNFPTYCSGGNPDTLDLDAENGVRTVYASTVVRWMPRE